MNRYALQNQKEEVEEEEEEEMIDKTARRVLLRDRAIPLSHYIMRIIQTAPTQQLSLSQLIYHTGFPIKRLSKKLTIMEKAGLIQSQLLNDKRSFIRVYRLTSTSAPLVETKQTVVETRQTSDQAVIRRKKILDIVLLFTEFYVVYAVWSFLFKGVS